MTLTGTGALSTGDVALFRTGYLTLLPRDESGRGVICANKLIKNTDSSLNPDARIRCAFFILHIASGEELFQKNGCVFLQVFHPDKVENPSRKLFDFLQNQPLALECKAIHFILLRERCLLQTLIPVWLSLLDDFFRRRTVVHFVKNEEAIMAALLHYGLRPEGLSTRLGGTYVRSPV